jgi:hypothetical protein
VELYCFPTPPQNVRPKVRGDEEEEEEEEKEESHTHTHKHTQRTRRGDHGSTDKSTERKSINQIDSSVNCKKVPAIQQKSNKHVIILTNSNPATTDLKPENKRSDQSTKTHKHRQHKSLQAMKK